MSSTTNRCLELWSISNIGSYITIFTSAAQAVDIESSDGAVELIKAAASLAAGIQLHYGSHHGIKLPDNTALVAQPVAAGVAALVTAEGYILGKFE